MNDSSINLFFCPDCKIELNQFHCLKCKTEFNIKNGVPILLSRQSDFKSVIEISQTYDDIYTNRSGVWEDQGRTPGFIKYFSSLIASYSMGSLLEIGCGEGLLLSELIADDKTAIDLSYKALEKSIIKNDKLTCAVALAERLPFKDKAFDIAVSVGVMEHFIDDEEALKSIYRVIKPGGYYISLIHVALTRHQELLQKIREYIYPKPRPMALLKWVISKVYRPIFQPIQRRYTEISAKDCLIKQGFLIEKVISLKNEPDAPLVGRHVIIYVARRPE